MKKAGLILSAGLLFSLSASAAAGQATICTGYVDTLEKLTNGTVRVKLLQNNNTYDVKGDDNVIMITNAAFNNKQVKLRVVEMDNNVITKYDVKCNDRDSDNRLTVIGSILDF